MLNLKTLPLLAGLKEDVLFSSIVLSGDQIQLIDTDKESKLPKSASSDSDVPVRAESSPLHAAQKLVTVKKKM